MNKLKKYKSIFWGGVVTVLSLVMYLLMSNSRGNSEGATIEKEISRIPVSQIKPELQKVHIPILGKIQAQRRFDIYSEVNGIITKGHHDLLSGNFFKKGEVIGQINADQFRAELLSQKSAFKARIVSVMAIVKIDFTESFNAWYEYLNHINPQMSLAELPEYGSDKEALYFISNGIEELYYKIKSQEELLKKYTLVAPFDGFLSAVDIKEGALLTAGQRVATFIGSNQLDIVVDIQKEHLKWVSIGDTLILENGIKAPVSRVSNLVNQNTQTVQIYASIIDTELFDGEYISGDICCAKTVVAYKVHRKLIIDDSSILIEANNVVKKVNIEKLLSMNDYTLVRGLNGPINLLNKISGLKVGQKIIPVQVN